MTPAAFNPRAHSLPRACALVLGSLALAIPLSHFPRLRPDPFMVLPALIAIVGTADTMRCIQRRWNLYHAGVILCIYMDLMTVVLILFLLFYPYTF